MRYVLLILLTAISVISVNGESVDSPLVVEHIGLRDGLSNNFVTDITQDKHGFIWIGTEAGLNLFDGENFKLFSESNTELKGNSINALFYDDRLDKLWIGSKKGLDVLDCKTWKFEKLKLPENLGSINVVDFCRSAEGGIYIVNHYDFILHYDPNDNNTLYIVKKIYLDCRCHSEALPMTDKANCISGMPIMDSVSLILRRKNRKFHS